MSPTLSVQQALSGRRILLTGASGFVGKVWLCMLLDKVPDVARVYVLMRGKKKQSARERFEAMVNESYAFKPLHDRHGEDLGRFLSERIEVVSGDVSVPGLGIDGAVAARLVRDLDLVVHVAGQVDFNPELSDALSNNVDGTLHAAELATRAPKASFLQVSTCFVAGNREGRILEEAQPNYTPNGLPLDVEAEQALLKQLVADVHESVMGPKGVAELRAEVEKSVAEKGHDPKNVQLVERIVRREEKARLTERLVDAGKARAQHYGFPNVYTFTKSLAESALIARFPALNKSFFRPAIVESAVSFPLPGWNEGLNTSGPLVYFTGTWFRHLPARKDKPLDVVPVDFCCAGIMAVAAALVEGTAGPAYQCATSDKHPLTVGRGLELTSLAHRRHYRENGVDAIERVILSRWDNKVVGDDHPINVDNMRKLTQTLADALKDVPKGLPERLRKELKKLGTKSDRLDRKLSVVEKVIDTYKPFVSDNRQTFSCDELCGLRPEEPFFRYEPEKLDWRRYWIDQHVPGLRRWSFPIIESEKVEVYSPKVPVRLSELREESAPAQVRVERAEAGPSKKRVRSVDAPEVFE
jgi:Male sterility protein